MGLPAAVALEYIHGIYQHCVASKGVIIYGGLIMESALNALPSPLTLMTCMSFRISRGLGVSGDSIKAPPNRSAEIFEYTPGT